MEAGMFYHGLYHIVCEDQVILLRNLSYMLTHPIKPEDAFVDRFSRRNCANEKLHPAFCLEKGNDNLIDVVALPAQNTTIVLGFYGTQQVRSVALHEREYMIKSWRDDDLGKETASTKATGMISAVTYTNVTEHDVSGAFFNNNGKVCPFNYNITQTPDMKFDHLDGKLCVPLAQFLTCPQPWCAIQRIGASFTVREKGEYMVYLMRGLFFWKINLRELPLNVPRIMKAKFTGDSFDLCATSKIYSPHKDDVPCIPFQTEAAFAFYKDGDEYVFMKGAVLQWIATKNRARRDDSATDYVQERSLFSNVSKDDTTAAWWNNHEKSVYIFSTGHYTVFKLVGDPLEPSGWQWVDKKELDQMGLRFETKRETEIDAVITAGDKAYLVNTRHYFYEITETTVNSKDTREAKLTYSKLFSTKSDCYYNDQVEYYKLLKPYNEHEEEQENDKQFNLGRQSKAQPVGNTNLWIALIIMFGGLVVMVGWAGMYIFGGKEQKFIKVVVTQKHTGKVVPGSHVESPARARKRKMMKKMKNMHH